MTVRNGVGLILCTLLLSGCLSQSRQWLWVHPDLDYVTQNRESDIALCEQEAVDLSIDGNFPEESIRPYGDWGDFIFELCMEDKGWQLSYQLPGGDQIGQNRK